MPNIDDFSTLGKSVHALVNYKLNGHNIDSLLKNADKDVLEHWEKLISSKIFEHKPILTEWGFDCRIGNTEYWLNGRIDAVFHDEKNNKYIIADWKTGKNIPKDEDTSYQSMVYLYAFYSAQKDLGVELLPSQVEFQYISTKSDEIIPPIVYSEEKHKIFEERFLDLIDRINKLEKEPEVNGCNEKFCEYSFICNK